MFLRTNCHLYSKRASRVPKVPQLTFGTGNRSLMYGHARNNRMFPDIRTQGRNLPDTKCRTCYGNPVTLTSLVTATFFKARTKMNLNGLEIGLTKL